MFAPGRDCPQREKKGKSKTSARSRRS
jgi:hypothetical protein